MCLFTPSTTLHLLKPLGSTGPLGQTAKHLPPPGVILPGLDLNQQPVVELEHLYEWGMRGAEVLGGVANGNRVGGHSK